MSHNHKNFAYSTVTTPPSPATTGTTLIVQPGDGAKFPDVPFNATIWPASVQPISTNAEIVSVTNITDDTLTITRNTEGSTAQSVTAGYQIAATITAKTLTDAEDTLPFWTPFILGSGAASSMQTLATATGQSSTASLFMFPVTIPSAMNFNLAVVVNSMSVIGSAATGSNTYYSKFGFYSMNSNTLSLITSNSFSIGESWSNNQATWNFPTTTATSITTNGSAVGYGYGGFPAAVTGSAHYMSVVGSLRSIGLQFATNVSISGGVYWLGIMSIRSTANNSGFGLSNAGIVGQPVNIINQTGLVNGLLPIGLAASQWTLSNSHFTGWWGRHILGFIATSYTSFGGSIIPTNIPLSALGASSSATTATILPTVTFAST